MQLINNLIKEPRLTNVDREKINLILYNAYKKFAITKAIEFKTMHKYKCINIQKNELFFSSKIGLYKAIQKYNGKGNFINYSTIYINSELLRLLTDTYSLSSLPKKYRRKNQENEDNKYKNLLNVNLCILYEPWQVDTMFVSNENIVYKINKKYEESEKQNELIVNLSPFTKRIVYLKYYLYLNKTLSNKHVSELMCCSEETIRKNLLFLNQSKDLSNL
jgi:RNA polymerase sigma factor (sigma-70 family)